MSRSVRIPISLPKSFTTTAPVFCRVIRSATSPSVSSGATVMKFGLTIVGQTCPSNESSRLPARRGFAQSGVRDNACVMTGITKSVTSDLCESSVLRRARRRQRRVGPRGRRLGLACGRARRHRDEDDAAGVQLGEGPGRHPGRVRRRRLAGDPRRGRHAELARDGEPAPRRGADERGALARSTGSRSPASSSRARTAGYRLARCGGATRHRLLQVGDRTGHAITKALRETYEAGAGRGASAPRAHASLEPLPDGWLATFETKDGVEQVAARSRSCSRPAAAASSRRRRGASSPRTTRTRPARSRGSRSTPAPRRATSTRSSTTRTAARGPSTMQGYSIPETTRAYGAVLLNADGEEFTDSLGAARRRLAGDLRRGREGQGRADPRRAAGGLARHDPDLRGGRRRSRSRTCCGAIAAAASTRSRSRS